MSNEYVTSLSKTSSGVINLTRLHIKDLNTLM